MAAGAFLVPYLLAFLFLGIPICWIEWTISRHAGRLSGLASTPGLFSVVTKEGKLRYLGSLALFIPIIIFMYYIYAESWCLAYAWFFITGKLSLAREELYLNFFIQFINNGAGEDFPSYSPRLVFFLTTFFLTFLLVFLKITKGIQRLFRFVLCVLLLITVVLVIRVLTLSVFRPELPAPEILDGLGYLWNPDWNQLTKPTVWITAIGQLFFTLSVGIGIIHTCASSLTKKDDIVLSGLTTCAAKEFIEICLGGLIFIPAAFIFFGITDMESIAKAGTFSLSFIALPPLFDTMAAGWIIGACFYFLVFLAGLYASITLLQPLLIFFEEGFGLRRNMAVFLLLILTLAGSSAIFFSPGLTVMDTADYYTCNVVIPVFALLETLLFIFFFKVETGIKEAGYGAAMKIPRLFGFTVRYITPLFLLGILGWGLFEQMKLWLNPGSLAGGLLVSWNPDLHDSLVQWFKPDWNGWQPQSDTEVETIVALTIIFVLIAFLQFISWPRMSRRYHAYLHALPPEEQE